jgi:hypothetical protein
MLERLRQAFKPEKSPDEIASERILALYQRFWREGSSQHYVTAALLRQDKEWVVVAMDGEFRGAVEVSLHATLEDARDAIIRWVGEPREVTGSAGLIAPSVWAKLRYIALTGDIDSDPPDI